MELSKNDKKLETYKKLLKERKKFLFKFQKQITDLEDPDYNDISSIFLQNLNHYQNQLISQINLLKQLSRYISENSSLESTSIPTLNNSKKQQKIINKKINELLVLLNIN